MGCIFYQLVYQRPAFSSDLEVGYYQWTGSSFKLPMVSEILTREDSKTFLSSILLPMLEIQSSKRPSATEVRQTFNDFCGFLNITLRPFFSPTEFEMISGKPMPTEKGSFPI